MAEDAKQRGESMVYEAERRSARMYTYVGAIGRTKFCYTWHRDANGDYWCLNLVRPFYKPKAQIGELMVKDEKTHKVRCAKARDGNT